ncbi:unnamed protein product [Leptosia nina]|uniref:Uncharacterized protein n=1 Tax=Leptosia nina TaxID=320188 RepID=A0AAV1JNY2_9NEOP
MRSGASVLADERLQRKEPVPNTRCWRLDQGGGCKEAGRGAVGGGAGQVTDGLPGSCGRRARAARARQVVPPRGE